MAEQNTREAIRAKLLSEPERELGIWRQSRWYGMFWLKTIFTLGLWTLLFWQHNYISLTTRRVTQKRGAWLTTNETSLSLENVTDVTVNKGVFGSIFGYGDISISTAGSSGAEIHGIAIPRPEKLRSLIFDLTDGRLDQAHN
ncbi:MAG: PH domain-containing protein [Candidatus Flexifilum sp.]|jgi:membrane protein YdbS with pleckstrin-like domain